MTNNLNEIAVPERTVNITIEEDEEVTAEPIDMNLQKQLLAVGVGDKLPSDCGGQTTIDPVTANGS